MLLTVLATTLALQAVAPETTLEEEPRELLGWTIAPPAPIEGQETELDRLSRSASGRGFTDSVVAGVRKDDRIPVEVTLRGLDKITAQFTDMVVPIGETVTFGTLTLVPRTCSNRPPEEFPETAVFLEVYADEDDVAGQRARVAEEVLAEDELAPLVAEEDLVPVIEADDSGSIPVANMVMASIDEALFGEAIFKGWMFASSPSINAMEHPTYDVWVINCTMEDPEI
ncbi:MAG: DUF2155 domain-containing protein [Parvularculaceae bacterium]|nr:DUF2155 domain-containing protein [Parvularculaceae bacterium]